MGRSYHCVIAMSFVVCGTVEAGRGRAKCLIRYPVILGLCAQIFGICVTVPLLITPGLILGGSNGAVSEFRAKAAAFQVLPRIVLTALVFFLTRTDTCGRYPQGFLVYPFWPCFHYCFVPIKLHQSHLLI